MLKTLAMCATAASLSACTAMGFGGWVATHQATLAAVALTAGTVSQVETAAINAITLKKELAPEK